MLTPKPSGKVNIDADAKTKSTSIPHTKTRRILTPSLKSIQLWSPRYSHVDFDASTQKPSYFRSWRWKRVIFDRNTKTNQWRSTTPKWSHFRQRTQQPNPFHPTLESSQARSLILRSSQFGPPTKMQVKLHASTKSKWFFALRSKTNSISTTHTTTESNWSPHWNQVKFDPPHWN